jgi:DNA-binding transcriptional LysR family regulator
VQLLQRTKRQVRLTEAGRKFFEEAREILVHVDQAVMAARGMGSVGSERLRVGFAVWTDLSRLFAVVKSLDQLQPTIRLDLRTMPVPHQIEALTEGALDVGFIRAISPHPLLHSELLVSEPFVVAMSKRHHLAQRRRLKLSMLAKEPFILGPHDAMPDFYNLTLEMCRDAGFAPIVRDEVDYPFIVLGLVATGVGISLVPASMRKLQTNGVLLRALEPSPLVLQTSVAWRRDNQSRTLAAFLELVRAIMRHRN